MGESACLVHSFSLPATIPHESNEDNPLHALSQSISFGRFMTESLEWEKWSSFSHKKYVEEAEKYSRPGSVAQKKAFFEARYKKIAAAKKAAAAELLEQQTTYPSASENACESESVQKQEVKEQNTDTGLVVDADGSDLNVKKDNNSQRSKVQMDDSFAKTEVVVEHSMTVDSLNKPVVMDNETRDVMVPNGIEQKENCTKSESLKKNGSSGKKDEDRELLKKNGSAGKKDEDRELLKKIGSIHKKDEDAELLKKIGSIDKKDPARDSFKKNVSDSSRMSEKFSTPLKTPNAEAKHSLSEKRSESKAHGSADKAGKSAVRRWGFLPMICLCFKPKLHKERGTTKSQMKKVQNNSYSRKVLD